MLIKDLSANKNYRTALLILVVSLIWLGSGLVTSHDTIAQEDRVSSDRSLLVKAKRLEAVDFIPSVTIKGRTEANRQVVLRSQVAGRLEFQANVEGQIVEQGDLLCRLAEEDKALKLQQARSSLAQAKIEYDGALALKSAGYQSKQAIASAKAKMDAASAHLKRQELEYEYLEIRAPFKSVVESFSVEQGDLLNVGSECAQILELDPLLVAGQVSEKVVSQLAVGMPVEVVLAGQQSVSGRLQYVASQADAVTRTFRIEVAINNSDFNVRAGLTAEMNVKLAAVKAHNVPSSLLVLDDAGRIGLKYLDAQNMVHFALIETIDDSQNGVWVRGLPDSTTLITIGQEYVSEGQRVEASLEDPSMVQQAQSL